MTGKYGILFSIFWEPFTTFGAFTFMTFFVPDLSDQLRKKKKLTYLWYDINTSGKKISKYDLIYQMVTG